MPRCARPTSPRGSTPRASSSTGSPACWRSRAKPLSAFRHFQLNSEVPFGARKFTQRVEGTVGKAALIRSGRDNPPRVGAAAWELEQKVHYLGIVAEFDIFEQASDAFANSGRIDRLFRGANRGLLETSNELFWRGHDDVDIWGVLNHPHIARKAVSTVFQRRGSASAMLNELFALADYPSEASGGAMLAEKMLVSLRMYNIISQTYVTISGSNSQISVREQFLKDHATIREIAVADELKDAGGTGVDGVFCYRDDEDGVSLVMPAGPTVLPMQGELYNLLVPFFGGIGGVLIPYAGHHIIGLVEVQ